MLYRNKMSIHIEAGNIFFEIVNSGESILDFNAAQQNYDKKLLQIKFSYSKDYCSYVSEYLIMAIESVIDINYGALMNKNTKFFYNFNDCLDRKGFPVQYVRHRMYGLLQLQQRDWSYFIGKLFELSEKDDFELGHLGTETDIEENELLLDTIANLQICENFCNSLYVKVSDNLQHSR